MINAGILLNVVAGALTTLSPCVFPVLPLVMGGAVQRHRLAPVAMGAGMVGAFASIGVLVGALGSELNVDASDARHVGALLLFAFGLMMLFSKMDNLLKGALAPVANWADKAASRMDGAGLWQAAALGGLLGIIWSPCSGPLLGAALTLVATEGKAAEGALRLGLFGLGAATPLVAVAYASRSGMARARQTLLAHGDKVRLLTGIVMAATGAAIWTGLDKVLEASLTSILPDFWIHFVTRY